MKKFLLFLFCFFSLLAAQAQDIIFKTSGDKVPARVTEIRTADILYQTADSLPGGPVLSLPKADVFMVQYANGTIEMIKLDVPKDTLGTIVQSPEELYRRGRRDARLYYRGRGVFWSSVAAGATALITGGIALTAPVAMAVTPPSRSTLRVPDAKLAQNQDYMKGYRKQAHIRKVGKAAAGTGTGIVTGFGILIGLVMFVVL